MSVVSEIRKLFTYRDNIANIIRSKGVEVPENTKLRDIPDYMADLQKVDDDTEEFLGDWSEELFEQELLKAHIEYDTEHSKYTGHVDVDGLKEIGWSDSDIEYFQMHGVDWMEEDDDQYLVSDYEKNLYKSNTMIAKYTSTNVSNNDPDIVEWRNNIRWMPKFTIGNLNITFRNFEKMIGCPFYNFASASSAANLFSYCRELRCIQPLIFKANTAWSGGSMFMYCNKLRELPVMDWSYCNSLSSAFKGCTNLVKVPEINVPNCTNASAAFWGCRSLKVIDNIVTSSKLTNVTSMFGNCRSLVTVPLFDTSSATSFKEIFANCFALKAVPSFDVTKVTTFDSAWRNCNSVIKLPDMNFQPIVTTYASMCQCCTNLMHIPTTMDFTATTSISNMFDFCESLEEFPYKLNLNASATSAAEGIKTFTQPLSNSKIKELSFGKFYCTGDPNFGRWSTTLEKVSIDDFAGGTKMFGTNCNLDNTTVLDGELRGINKSMSFTSLANMDRESILRVLNAVEDVTGQVDSSGNPFKLTFGTERLRILTADEKAIATSKGWVLA